MSQESYVLDAFTLHKLRTVQHSKYKTLIGLTRGVKMAMEAGADYVSLRRIRPEEAEA